LRRLQGASSGESWIMSWEKEQEERKETSKRQQTRWKQTQGNRREVNMSSSSGSSNSNTGDQKGRWRQCAGAIIFNEHMEVLIGRRKENGNYWQFPQGGIEAVYLPPPAPFPHSLAPSLPSLSLSLCPTNPSLSCSSCSHSLSRSYDAAAGRASGRVGDSRSV
jgi:hypothetical protein